MSGLFSNFEKQSPEKQEEKIDKNLILSYYPMKFEVDDITFDFLKSQTIKIHNTANKMHTDLGKIFYDTREKLSNNKNGIFEKWYAGLGFKRQSVYRLINRYDYILSKWEDKIKIESLPVTLSYEISHPECSEELRAKVLSGEIKSLKEFKATNLLENKEIKSEPEVIDIIDFDFFYKKYENIINTSSEKFETLSNGKKEKLKKYLEKIDEILL